MNRFENLTKNNGILVNGKVIKIQTKLEFKIRQQLSTVVEYITDYRSYKLLQPYFKQNLDSLFPDSTYLNKPTELMKLMGQEFVSKWQREEAAQEYFAFSSDRNTQKNMINIDGYQYVFMMNEYFGTPDTLKDSTYVSTYSTGAFSCSVRYSSFDGGIKIFGNDTTTIEFNIHEFVKQLQNSQNSNSYNIQSADMIIAKENKQIKAMLVITSINGNYRKSKQNVIVNNIQCEVYVKMQPMKTTPN